MQRPLIDPLVDCVFKALFGDPANKDLLLSFVNAVTRHDPPLVEVEILNPYSPEEFVGDDLRVVDVRAQDASGAQLQLEVQLVVRRWLASRMLYTWADLYQGQLQRGEHFRTLRPVISIWVLAENLLADDRWHHRFQLWDRDAGVTLSDHLEVHTLELRKWRPHDQGPDEGDLAGLDAWAYFLREARRWTELPVGLRGPVMEKAMSVLDRFSQKGEDYHRYQARMNHLREQAAIAEEQAEILAELTVAKGELDQTKGELDQTKGQLDQTKGQLDQTRGQLDQTKGQLEATTHELEAKEQALAERDQAIARLKERLAALGLDPEV